MNNVASGCPRGMHITSSHITEFMPKIKRAHAYHREYAKYPITRACMVLTIALSPMMSSAAADSYCLACGEPATLRNRRILCSEASSNVRTTWELLLDERLKLRGAQIDVAYLLGNEQSPNPGCMCKKCFMSVKAFSERISCYRSWILPLQECQGYHIRVIILKSSNKRRLPDCTAEREHCQVAGSSIAQNV